MPVRTKLALALLGLLCCSVSAGADQSSVRVEMGGVKQMRYDRSGKLVAVIQAERATVDDEGMLVMEEVKGTVRTDDGEEMEIRASRAEVDAQGTGDAIFEGVLEVAFSDLVAKTSRATWDESDRTVTGDEEVVIEGKVSRIVGSGFMVFTSGDKAVIYQPRGTVQLKNVEDTPGHD